MKKSYLHIKSWRHSLIMPAVVCLSSPIAYAATYFSVEQAQQAIFPRGEFNQVPVILTDQQRRAIKKKSGVSARVKEQRIWRVNTEGYFIIDEVVGKHEFVTYAVGLNTDGSVKQIEIMEYRESYGYEIRDENWRKQFVGKSSQSQLKLDHDIKNISGATLSCRHIADGVKRILAMYEIVLR